MERLELLSSIFEIEPFDLMNFDDKKIFNNVFNDTSNGYFAEEIIANSFEKERESYLNHIQHLESEIIFLRDLLKSKP